jgi:hypothetical protein
MSLGNGGTWDLYVHIYTVFRTSTKHFKPLEILFRRSKPCGFQAPPRVLRVLPDPTLKNLARVSPQTHCSRIRMIILKTPHYLSHLIRDRCGIAVGFDSEKSFGSVSERSKHGHAPEIFIGTTAVFANFPIN